MPQPSTAPFLRLFLLVSVSVVVLAFGIGWWNAGMVKEGGALELATVAALFLLTALFVRLLPNRAFGPEWHIPVLTLLLAFRELDFDKRFMETGILKLRLYTGDAPLGAKLIGAVVIVLVLVCLYRLLRLDGRGFLRGLRRGEGWAVLIALGVVGVVVAKSVDGLGRKLAPFGIDLTEGQGAVAVFTEESLELCFALALLAALFLWVRRAVRAAAP